MPGSWDVDFYDEWDEQRQGLFDEFATQLGDTEVYNDILVQAYVDVL